MLVLASTGLKVPLEEKPRQYITDTAPKGQSGFEVAETTYYLRRLAEGDLVRVEADASPKKTTAASQDVAPVTA